MKRETILKTGLILLIGAILLAMPVNVFATEPTDLDKYFNYEDQGDKTTIEGDTPTETPTTPEPEQTTPSTETTQEPEETLPKAGLAEDTMMVVTIAGLVLLATVAYKKINEYQNI